MTEYPKWASSVDTPGERLSLEKLQQFDAAIRAQGPRHPIAIVNVAGDFIDGDLGMWHLALQRLGREVDPNHPFRWKRP